MSDLPVGRSVGMGKIGMGGDTESVNRYPGMHIRLVAAAWHSHRALNAATLQRTDQRGDMDFSAAYLVREIGERHMEYCGSRELAASVL